MHPNRRGHDIELPRSFGRGVNYAIAVCRKCGAQWQAYYSRKGLVFKPLDANAKSKCPRS